MKKVLINVFTELYKIKLCRKLILKLINKLDDNSLSGVRGLASKFYNVKIGRYSYVYDITNNSISKGTKIGSFCSIAPGVRIGGMNHPINLVSTHPFLYYKNRGFVGEDLVEFDKSGNPQACIGDDVWIGQNAIILPGVNIGRGSVIGAGAVVTKDIPDYSIAVGVPAVVKGKRFNEETIRGLKTIDWTSWSDEDIKKNLHLYYDVEKFVESYGNLKRVIV